MKKNLHCTIFLVSLMVCLSNTIVQAQWRNLYEKKLLISQIDTLPYRVMMPQDFDANKIYPIVFVLHGGGERGKDNERQLVYGASLFADSLNRLNFPAIIVFPQCSWDSYWAKVIRTELPEGGLDFVFQPEQAPSKAGELLLELIEFYQEKSFVDRKRMYLGGLSMGGIGTMDILYRKPNTFAASFVICGGGNPERVSNFASKVDLWIFHGEKDNVVRPEYIKEVIASMKAQNIFPKVTFYPEVGHNAWEYAFQELDFLPWLFKERN